TRKIGATLTELGIPYNLRVASAHKTPHRLLEIVDENERSESRFVYITVAGRSNALSGFVDANTRFPVIACPPLSATFSGADIYSSLRMPSGVAPLVVLDPANAGLAAAKILALSNDQIREKVKSYQQRFKDRVNTADLQVKKSGRK
ncbi:MAG: AIR carboxylase family protein, partial [Candidatus Bathyarchaeota archaeon]